jgi:transglutaminase-like putative cysteine protease
VKNFLEKTRHVNYDSVAVMSKASELFHSAMTVTEKARVAYLFVRDAIPHSFDCNALNITALASDVLIYKTGICHAKANLLAALLRSQGIPTGFCYQHLTLANDDSKGYCLHCYNAIYLEDRWVKVDARGNTNGICAQFSTDKPVLAFANRVQYDEYFFEGIYPMPDMPTMEMLEHAKTLQDVIIGLPERPSVKPSAFS